MIDSLFARTYLIARFQKSPLQPHLSDLASILNQQGYSRNVIRTYLCSGEKFGRWMTANELNSSDVDERLIGQYIDEIRREGANSGSRKILKARAGLSHLVRVLRERQVILPAPVASPGNAVDTWLLKFEQYLVQVVGAAVNTRKRYLSLAKRFVDQQFGDGPIQWGSLQADHITAFVSKEAATKKGFGRKAVPVAIRAVLRFLVSSGEIRAGLEAAVPTMRNWKYAALPRHVPDDQLERALANCRDISPKSRRNLAILLLLARLGMRANEVVQLRLEDIDWRSGQLFIRPGKTHTERVLPLSQEVGDCLAEYLTKARPRSESLRFFLNYRPPFLPLAGASAVTKIAKRALLNSGFEQGPLIGAHNFRHTVASAMVSKGATFKDVADVLGHQSLQTTGIYAKLDLKALAKVALPWGGGAK
jgi:integrase/recombinase XerD